MIEIVPLDGVHERRAARRWPESGNTSGALVMCGAAGQAGELRGDRIGAVKVVEQPAVQAIRGEGAADRGHVEAHKRAV